MIRSGGRSGGIKMKRSRTLIVFTTKKLLDDFVAGR
jgi:hypothetical protein